MTKPNGSGEHRWTLRGMWPVGVGAALTLILGTIGWSKVPSANSSALEPFYRAVALFGFEGAVDGGQSTMGVPTSLEIARILGPIVTGYAVVRALMALFREQFQVMWTRLMHDHVVVVGLGSTGFRLAEKFHEKGRRVVAVELNRETPAVAGCRERRITVLTGDGTDPEILAKARVGQASAVVIACGDDRVDLDVAKAAEKKVPQGRSGPLIAYVSVDRLDLWEQLTAEALASPAQALFKREFFNVYLAAAKRLLAKHDPYGEGEARHSHVMVVGFDGVAESLVLGAARLWQAGQRGSKTRLRFTIVDPGAEEQRSQLLSRYPQLGEICDIDARPIGTDSVEFREGRLAHDRERGSLGAIYICLEDEGQGLAAALALVARSDGHGTPIVMAVQDHTAGAAGAVDADRLKDVAAFGVLSETLTPELVEGGTRELIARSIHAHYVAAERAKGETRATNPSMLEWDELSEHVKKSNLASADGIGDKLRKRSWVIVPALLLDPGGPLFDFSDDDVEEMAKEEHIRWCRFQEARGITYAPVRDELHHPSLVDWDDLSPSEQEKDRVLVRAIPAQLAGAGFEICPRG